MMGFGHGWNFGMQSFTGGVFMILLWVLIVLGVIYLVKNNNITDNNNTRQYDNAIELARKRYARGEINKEEFEKIMHDLK